MAATSQRMKEREMAQQIKVGQDMPGLHERRTVDANAAFLTQHLQPGMSLLDVGCGPGTITIGLADWLAPGKVTGVDLDPKRIQQATGTASAQGVTNVTFQTGDAYQLPFPDGSFDAAFMTFTLMHLKDRGAAVSEVMRVLKPGGIFGAREMNMNAAIHLNAAPEYWEAVPLMQAHLINRGIDIYAGATLGALVRDAGFAEVKESASFNSDNAPDRLKFYAEQQATRLEANIGDWAIEQGLMTRADIQRMAKAIREWTHRDEFSAGGMGEVVAWKATA